MKTIKDIKNLIASNLSSGNVKLANHATTLQGPRKRGSTTECGIDILPDDRELQEFTEEFKDVLLPGTRAYWCPASELEPQVAAKQLSRLSSVDVESVRVRKGLHGFELYLEHSQIGKKPVDYVTFIIGEFAGELAVFTWHPGKPMGVLGGFTAVKLS